jgi:polyisoprenoid-binding protein YceI
MFTRVMMATAVLAGGAVSAAPAIYDLDPSHTYPSFEADHLGISLWRGKMNQSRGTLTLDKAAGTGSVEVDIDLDSIDFGQDALNAWAIGKEFFDTAQYPDARFKGRLIDLNGKAPRVDGELSLRGITRPVTLNIAGWECIEHPMLKRDYCGADATGVFKRDEFGLTAGKDYGFNMDVSLRIQVEAVKREEAGPTG